VSVSLLFHTVRHLRRRQMAGQLRVRLRGLVEDPARFRRLPAPAFPGGRWKPRAGFLPPGPQENPAGDLLRGEFRFVNRRERLGWPPRWSGEQPRLWQYNLHYFEYLWALDYADARTVVADWIAAHELERGRVGWEPYPTSLRLVNWCGYFFGRHADRIASDPAFRDTLWRSVHLQAEWLAAHLETHLLGNHLLENAASLAFCGSCFAGPQAEAWYRRGRELLARELPEQVLEDGGHCEHSPMYQLRVAWVLTALRNAGRPDLIDLIEEPLERTLRALGRLCHPDGEIALFNDSALDVYNAAAPLRVWWAEVIGRPESALGSPAGAFALPASGFHGAIQEGGDYVICDAGRLGPDHLLGHAHGGIFSFELSLRGQRVIVDSGVHGYEPDAMRHYCRSTRAHNTVEIDGQSQCEFWSAFRVGRRGHPRDVEWTPTGEGFRLAGWHDGYQRLRGRPRHRRLFAWHERGILMVKDVLTSAREVTAVSRLHLHPDCRIARLSDDAAGIEHPRGHFGIRFAGEGALAVEPSWYCPRFGTRVENRALTFTASGSRVENGFCIASGCDDFAFDLASGARAEGRSFGW
jgi:uncharacterized heparinase superfamily protein